MKLVTRYFCAFAALFIFSQISSACGFDILQSLVRKWAKPVLKEYRFPAKKDIKYYWLECQNTNKPCPYWTTGDYNGDGAKDYACILIRGKDDGYGVFAIVSKGKKYEYHALVKSKETNYQSAGLELVNTGVYRTANGKGYGTHDPNEPDSVIITHQAINYYRSECSSVYYYWDNTSNTFKEVWISD